MANFNFNKVILGGRLTSAPELRQTQSGLAVAVFSLAVNKRVPKESAPKADFFQITAWRGTAEMAAKYLRKGSAVCIVGSLSTSYFEDKDGNRRSKTEVTAEEITFIDSKSDFEKASAPGESTGAELQNYNVSDGETLPF